MKSTFEGDNAKTKEEIYHHSSFTARPRRKRDSRRGTEKLIQGCGLYKILKIINKQTNSMITMF
jgi:hypothetical protein